MMTCRSASIMVNVVLRSWWHIRQIWILQLKHYGKWCRKKMKKFTDQVWAQNICTHTYFERDFLTILQLLIETTSDNDGCKWKKHFCHPFLPLTRLSLLLRLVLLLLLMMCVIMFVCKPYHSTILVRLFLVTSCCCTRTFNHHDHDRKPLLSFVIETCG